MKVTGIQIREAIKRWTLRRDASAGQFSESLWQFSEDKNTTTPVDLMKTFQEAEAAIARLQLAQTRYEYDSLPFSIAARRHIFCIRPAPPISSPPSHGVIFQV